MAICWAATYTRYNLCDPEHLPAPRMPVWKQCQALRGVIAESTGRILHPKYLRKQGSRCSARCAALRLTLRWQ